MHCIHCGKEIQDDTKFCAYCGQPVQELPADEVPAKSDTEPVCPQCGTILMPDQRFCSECGTPVAPTTDDDVNRTNVAGIGANASSTHVVTQEIPRKQTSFTENQTAAMPGVGTPESSQNATFKAQLLEDQTQAMNNTFRSAKKAQSPPYGTPVNFTATQTYETEPSQNRTRKGPIIGLVASVAVLIVVVVGIVFFASGQGSTTPKSVTTLEETSSSDSSQSLNQSDTSSNSGSSSTSNSSSSKSSSTSDLSSAATPSTAQSKAFTLQGNGETWAEAQAYCESHGAMLACIETKDDYEQILSLLNNSSYVAVFVGGYYDAQQNTWLWVNGQPFTFTTWAKGEPNNETGDEYYLALLKAPSGWGWYDDTNDISGSYNSAKIGFVMQTS